jgi:pyruvate/2-oxoglutarate dehydrogenase complex dihydrolipoamide acyltransferase (E2) component
MTKVIVKHRLFTWFEETDSAVQPGQTVMTERIAHMGDEIDIPNDNPYLARGRQPDIDAFYTDKEADQIRANKYRGPDADTLYRFRSNTPLPAVSRIEPLDDEGPQIDALSAEDLADYITENKLTGPQTIALAGETLESVEKVLDAENIASDNSPRADVVQALEAKMTAIATGGSGNGGNGNGTTPTDAAVKLAKENDVDLSTMTGTGSGGRIIATDVQAVIEARS